MKNNESQFSRLSSKVKVGKGEENGNKIVMREDRVSLGWEKKAGIGNQTLQLRMGISSVEALVACLADPCCSGGVCILLRKILACQF